MQNLRTIFYNLEIFKIIIIGTPFTVERTVIKIKWSRHYQLFWRDRPTLHNILSMSMRGPLYVIDVYRVTSLK